ncbi:hypothetical protein N1851_008120 [Merluccius polli]|uniref:Myb/SANT-like DNA-binding domain-containing protein n=1 Tax=Merluccius polli TaxID=89951 RepID=A0AA47N1W1_MERPO|nr:hypothetical protein N1851_008120 [Merluccius polli]
MMNESEEKAKRKRKPNWSQDQLLLLAQFVLERRGIIKGKFGSGVTSKKKREAWEDITFNINASFPAVCRSTDDCEKRWYALQSQSRSEIADCKRAVAATVASVVYAVLGSDTSITGLEGAADPAFELLKEIEGRITMCNCSTHFPKMCFTLYIFPTGEIKMKVLDHIRRLLLFSPSELFLSQLFLSQLYLLSQLHLLSQLFLSQLFLSQLFALLVHPLPLLSLLLLPGPVHWRKK